MQLPSNAFQKALKSGQQQIGLWVSMGDSLSAEIVAGAGFDWVLLDTEHTHAGYQDVLHQLQAFAPYPTTALVRPDWNDTVQFKRYLDLGSQGFVVPMVNSAEEARAAVAALRYPPKGARGMAGATRATGFGRYTDYLDRVDAETTLIVQVETRAALAQAEAIGTVEGVDGVFFGPADIAADMGMAGQPLADPVWAAVREAAAPLMARGVPVGTLVTDAKFATGLLNEGFTFVACGIDTDILRRGSDALLADVKAGLKAPH